jgi:hypothetical protein
MNAYIINNINKLRIDEHFQDCPPVPLHVPLPRPSPPIPLDHQHQITPDDHADESTSPRSITIDL